MKGAFYKSITNDHISQSPAIMEFLASFWSLLQCPCVLFFHEQSYSRYQPNVLYCNPKDAWKFIGHHILTKTLFRCPISPSVAWFWLDRSDSECVRSMHKQFTWDWNSVWFLVIFSSRSDFNSSGIPTLAVNHRRIYPTSECFVHGYCMRRQSVWGQKTKVTDKIYDINFPFLGDNITCNKLLLYLIILPSAGDNLPNFLSVC